MVNAQSEALFGYQRDRNARPSVEMLVPERFRQQSSGFAQFIFLRNPSRGRWAQGAISTV